MKYFGLSLFLLFIGITNSFSQDMEIKPGTVLNYLVSPNNAEEYNFIVIVKKFGVSGIDFDWKMTTTNPQKGKVSISANAFESSHKYINYFKNGSILKLNEESAIWMSKDDYASLAKTKVLNIDMGNGVISFSQGDPEAEFEIELKGKTVTMDTVEVEDKSGDLKLSLLNDYNDHNNRLIMSMKLKDFKIRLISVN